MVVLKDPEDSTNLLVRRLAATEGYEMASTDSKDEPFVLEKDQCWVLADNNNLKPKVYMLLYLHTRSSPYIYIYINQLCFFIGLPYSRKHMIAEHLVLLRRETYLGEPYIV